MNKCAQFVGLRYSEFEAKVLELYPFGDISFGGGGNLIVNTGLSFPDNYGYPVPENFGRPIPILIHTGLCLDDTKYDEEGEERICLGK